MSQIRTFRVKILDFLSLLESDIDFQKNDGIGTSIKFQEIRAFQNFEIIHTLVVKSEKTDVVDSIPHNCPTG